MKTPAAFLAMLGVAALGAFAVLRVSRPEGPPVAEMRVHEPTVVLTGHAATFALAHALSAHTTIEVGAAWPAGTPWTEHAEYVRQGAEEFQNVAQRATGVVSLRHAAPEDALYAAVRNANPRVIEIDASVAKDQRTPNVRLRAGDVGGPSFALSPTNAMRMAERIADDFVALHPSEAAQIRENLRATKELLVRMKATFERALVEFDALEVVVFTSHFDYLLEEFGIQVMGRIERDEALWTEADFARHTDLVRSSGAKTTVHAWAPGPRTTALLASVGVRPVVLHPQRNAPASPEEYFHQLDHSLAALTAALAPK